MAIIKIGNKGVKDFTIMSNIFLRDKKLSLKAKGLLAYLLTLPEDWQVYQNELQSHFKDGRDSIASAMDQLVKAGYVEKIKTRVKGLFNVQYTVSHAPLDGLSGRETRTGNQDGLTVTDKPGRINRDGLTDTVNPHLLNIDELNINKLSIEEVNKEEVNINNNTKKAKAAIVINTKNDLLIDAEYIYNYYKNKITPGKKSKTINSLASIKTFQKRKVQPVLAEYSKSDIIAAIDNYKAERERAGRYPVEPQTFFNRGEDMFKEYLFINYEGNKAFNYEDENEGEEIWI